jgi:hypothetical protein
MMGWKQRRKNRRHARTHVLDVKLSTRQVRLARVRFAVWLVTLFTATVAGIYVCWRAGSYGMERFVYRNQAFAIRSVEVETEGLLDKERIRRWTGVKPGDNIFSVNNETVRQNLQQVPLIRAAYVQRVLPDKLQVRVIQREPVAQVYLPFQARPNGLGHESAVYLLDDRGFVMPPLHASGEEERGRIHAHLPMLVGVHSLDLRPGRTVESPQVLAALRLIQAFDRSPMAGLVDLLRVDVSHPELLVAATHQNTQIAFAPDRLEEQLARWRVIHDFGSARGLVLSSLDLSVANHLPALWFDRGTVVPPAKSRSSKTPANRKKNV